MAVSIFQSWLVLSFADVFWQVLQLAHFLQAFSWGLRAWGRVEIIIGA